MFSRVPGPLTAVPDPAEPGDYCPLDGGQGKVRALPVAAVIGAETVVAEHQQVAGRDPVAPVRTPGMRDVDSEQPTW